MRVAQQLNDAERVTQLMAENCCNTNELVHCITSGDRLSSIRQSTPATRQSNSSVGSVRSQAMPATTELCSTRNEATVAINDIAATVACSFDIEREVLERAEAIIKSDRHNVMNTPQVGENAETVRVALGT